MKVLLLFPVLLCIDLGRGIRAESDRYHDNTLKKVDPLKLKMRPPHDPDKWEGQIIRNINTRSVKSNTKNRKHSKKVSKNAYKDNNPSPKKLKKSSKKVKSTSKFTKTSSKKMLYNFKKVKSKKAKPKRLESTNKRIKPKGTQMVKVRPARFKVKAKSFNEENSGGLLLYSKNVQHRKLKKESGSLCNTMTLVNEGEEIIIYSDTKRSPQQCTAEFKGSTGIAVGIQCERFALHTGGCAKEALHVSVQEEDDHTGSTCKEPHCKTFCGVYGPELESSTGFLRIKYSRKLLKNTECSYGLVCSVYGGSARPSTSDVEPFASCSGSCCLEKDYTNMKPKSTYSKSSKHSKTVPLFVVLLLLPPINESPESTVTEPQFGQPHAHIDQADSYLPAKSPPPTIPPSPISCPPQTISWEGCGRSQPQPQRTRVINGLDASPGEFPWAVLLIAVKSDGEQAGQCGGTLITSGWIVSAAHCFYNRHNYDAVLASMGDVHMPKDYTTMQSIFQVINHPEYNKMNLDNDIALLQLVEYVSFTDSLSPICLATPEEEDQMNSHDPKVTVAGWGFMKQNDNKPSRTLQKAILDVITLDKCRKYYSGQTNPVFDGNMCTYTNGKDACQGDSGGGLYHVLSSGRWVQVGVVSWGIGCAQVGNPGVYSRTVDKMQWISTVINTTTC